MSWHKVKIRGTDRAWSNYIRSKAGWKCQKCGKVCKVGDERIAQLECSHYHSRRKETVRFDPENTYALCSGCHKRMGGYRKTEDGEYDLWVKEMLGDFKYNMLRLRANQTGKRDDKLQMTIIKALTKKYDPDKRT